MSYVRLADTNIAAATGYLRRGLSIIPVAVGEKRPLVKWTPYRQRKPTEAEVRIWYTRWPEAGIAVVLGPISDLFVIDVDGPEAHVALLKHLSEVPHVPTAVSGSRKPYRYHLFFSDPEIQTTASFCPWHPTLEFRGSGGLVTLPPSKHPSGQQYEWMDGRSLSELKLDQPPDQVMDALRARMIRRSKPPAVSAAPSRRSGRRRFESSSVSRATREFLAGIHRDGPGWNARLFAAACDLAGVGVSVEIAIPWLLKGAAPWSAGERRSAIATIGSAYSMPRVAAREFFRDEMRGGTSISRSRILQQTQPIDSHGEQQ